MTFIASLRGRYSDVIEFASELGKRFGDLTNYDVLLACSEYHGSDIEYDTVLGHACIEAYDKGI